jgi:hypothetical protein
MIACMEIACPDNNSDKGTKMSSIVKKNKVTAMQVMTQLAFRGQCRQAFEHYEKVLGGKITVMNTFGGNDAKLPPGSTAAAQVRGTSSWRMRHFG